MGQWAIIIQGIGSHHNGADYDADMIASRAVQELERNGHNVTSATFTHGGANNIPVFTDTPK